MLDANDTVVKVFLLLENSGGEQYFGENVTKLSHSLQCAWHAIQAGADEETTLAALLHDIGHLLDTEDTQRHDRVGVINHDEVGGQWLRDHGFSHRLATLVESHVDAKRYLTATNETYSNKLSWASQETLRLQGGPMAIEEAESFAHDPLLTEKLRLRVWDELAKDPDWSGPDLAFYRDMLIRHLSRS